MKRDNYPPLAYLKMFGNNNPGIFEAYEELRKKEDKKWNDFDLCCRVAADYYKQFQHIPKTKKELEQYYASRQYQAAFLLNILEHWRQNKQVYSFPPVFFEMIEVTEDFTVEPDIFSYLPYKNIYIEMAGKANVHGSIVHFEKTK